LCSAEANDVFEFFGSGLGHILVEPTRLGTSNHNALDRIVVEGSKGLGVRQGFEHSGSVITFTQCEDVPSVMGGRTMFLFETAEKSLGLRTQLLEGFAQLVELGRRSVARRTVTG
jgi:hypothetical protein